MCTCRVPRLLSFVIDRGTWAMMQADRWKGRAILVPSSSNVLLVKHTGASIKWLPFCRRHFHEWKILYLHWNFNAHRLWGMIYNDAELVEVIYPVIMWPRRLTPYGITRPRWVKRMRIVSKTYFMNIKSHDYVYALWLYKVLTIKIS